MQKIKLSLIIAAVVMAGIGAVAFTPTATKIEKPRKLTEQWFQLKDMGDKFESTDYELVSSNPGCPTTHTSEVCGILVENNGGVPDQTSFDNIVSQTNDFSQSYPAKVQYRAP